MWRIQCLPPTEGFWTAASGLDCVDSAIGNIALAFCDVCNAPLRFGDWWHKMGAGYDLCCKHHVNQETSISRVFLSRNFF